MNIEGMINPVIPLGNAPGAPQGSNAPAAPQGSNAPAAPQGSNPATPPAPSASNTPTAPARMNIPDMLNPATPPAPRPSNTPTAPARMNIPGMLNPATPPAPRPSNILPAPRRTNVPSLQMSNPPLRSPIIIPPLQTSSMLPPPRPSEVLPTMNTVPASQGFQGVRTSSGTKSTLDCLYYPHLDPFKKIYERSDILFKQQLEFYRTNEIGINHHINTNGFPSYEQGQNQEHHSHLAAHLFHNAIHLKSYQLSAANMTKAESIYLQEYMKKHEPVLFGSFCRDFEEDNHK